MTTDVFDSADGVADPEAGVPRDQYDRYVLIDPTGRTHTPISTKQHGKVYGKAYTRATTFAKSIMDNYVLHQWQQRMAIKGLTMAPDLYALAAATSLDDREKLNQIAEDAKEKAGAKVRASIGTALHAFTEQVDKGQHPIVPAMWAPEIAAYVKLNEDLGLVFEPELIERVVVDPEDSVAGTFDRIARLTRDLTFAVPWQLQPITLAAGSYVMDDLKTGRDLSYGWNEIVIQQALYCKAKLMWKPGKMIRSSNPPNLVNIYDRMPEVDQRVALVTHLPVREREDQEAKATLFAVDLSEGRRAIDLCAAVRVWRKQKGLATAVEVVTVTGDDAGDLARHEAIATKPKKRAAKKSTVAKVQDKIADKIEDQVGKSLARITPVEDVPVQPPRPATWAEKIAQASSLAELSSIWRAARVRGQWTPELARLGEEQKSKIHTV